jgi:hypothetical protein
MYLNLGLRGQVTVPPRKQYGTVEDQIAISSLISVGRVGRNPLNVHRIRILYPRHSRIE